MNNRLQHIIVSLSMIVVLVGLTGCCGDKFNETGQGFSSMSGTTPTQSEKNISCIAAKAAAKVTAQSKCPPADKPKYTKLKIDYSSCTYVPDTTNNRVIATVGVSCACCD